MFAADIVGFTRPDRDQQAQIHLRHTLYSMVRGALAESGIPWEHCLQQDRGDGPLILIPPGIPQRMIIAPLCELLPMMIRRHNRFAIPSARLEVRTAANIGHVYRDEHGYAGADINLVCRMLDARPLRRQLVSTGTDMALMVSGSVYETIVQRHPALIDPALFRRVRTRVKRTRIDAWLYAPDKTATVADPGLAREDLLPGLAGILADGGIGRTWVRGQSFELTGSSDYTCRHVFPAR
jgi:hypothetical protein